MPQFNIVSDFGLTGDQPQAVDKLVEGLRKGDKHQILLGVTGSGKTFTMANVVERVQRPALVICHNKTLAAQLATEFRDFFPDNAVRYFVSYYDYYQPEAYIPRTDTYIEKEIDINEEIDKLRHAATQALFERRDVIIVASVSCIYSLGEPEEYRSFVVTVTKGEKCNRNKLVRRLIDMQYERNDFDFTRSRFRIRGDTLEVQPSYEDIAVRLEFWGDEVERIAEVDPLTGELLAERDSVGIYPAKHFVTSHDKLVAAIEDIKVELVERLRELGSQGKLLEAARLEQRTNYDVEMLREAGYCHAVENYSRHLQRRAPGSPPWTLLDYFPDDFLLFIDESHMTLPQIQGMYHGDISRKRTLVDYGFRLPSALDNRPLSFPEFEARVDQVVYVSATPSDYEMKKSNGQVVDQIIRPTGLSDPSIEVKPARNQVDDLLGEIQKRVKQKERVLVTTLTKRMAEDLTEYYADLGIRVKYLHSDIDTLDRVEIIRDLRLGKFDVLIGINLLREGLDLPEVSLVAILDADKEGFLRSEKSLIQTFGRAARNVNGQVILYGDKMTGAMDQAILETNRRRKIQEEYNKVHRITPQTVKKSVRNILSSIYEADYFTVPAVSDIKGEYMPTKEISAMIQKLKKEMKEAASRLEFERAAELRDRIHLLEENALKLG